MVIDDHGLYVTQRKLAAMALITVGLNPDTGALHLHAPNQAGIKVAPSDCLQQTECRIWHSTCQVLVAPTAVNQWVTRVLASPQPLRLVYCHPSYPRAVHTARFGEHTLGFADAAPFLITNTQSLLILNNALASQAITPLPMERFRPNIVLKGWPAFSEHTQQNAHLKSTAGTATFNLVDHCQRCSMITLEAKNHHVKSLDAAAIFKTLAQFNSMPNNPKAPAFGVNSTVAMQGELVIKVGMLVTGN